MPATWFMLSKFAKRRENCWRMIPGLGAARTAGKRTLLRRGRNLQSDAAGNGRQRLARRKLENILSTGADAVITANAGCILQIAREARQQGRALADLPSDGFARPELSREAAEAVDCHFS